MEIRDYIQTHIPFWENLTDEEQDFMVKGNCGPISYRRHPKVELYLYKTAMERFTEVMWMMQQILFMGADKRVAIFLWEEYCKNGSVEITFTHDEIARLIGNIVFQTWLVASGAANLKEAIKLFWSIRVPWGWTYTAGMVPDWVAQFSFGFYSLMLTSTLIGLIVMVLYKPRSWCTFCPMGTMTQGICRMKKK